MALASYSDLLAAVARFLHRSDLTAVIPDFVTLTEADLNARLRTLKQETRVTTTTTDEYLTLPSDYVALRRIVRQSSVPVPLNQITPYQLQEMKPDSGEPHYYAIVGNEIQVFPTPADSYTYEITYQADLDLATTGTNWLLTDSPDAYLYGALTHSATYTGSDARLPTWRTMYNDAVLAVLSRDKHAKWSGSPLVIRADVSVQ